MHPPPTVACMVGNSENSVINCSQNILLGLSLWNDGGGEVFESLTIAKHFYSCGI